MVDLEKKSKKAARMGSSSEDRTGNFDIQLGLFAERKLNQTIF